MKYNSKAVRLSDVIVRDIWDGCYEPGKYLPGEDLLAERYQVSRATIRRVLEILGSGGVVIKEPNRGSLINPGLKRDALLPAGKQPPHSGGTNRGNGQFTIGAIWATVPDALTIGISEGIRKYASENDLEFHLFQSTEGYEKVLDMLHHIGEAGIDGIITLPYNHPDYFESIRELVRRDYPVICVDRPVDGLDLACVEVDNYAGVYSAVVRMIVSSRGPVYYLGAQPENKPQHLRYEGFRSAMTDGGFAPRIPEYTVFYNAPDAIGEGDAGLNPAVRAALAILNRHEGPVSIMAMNDYIAGFAYQAARLLGRRVGKEVALFGFDDLPLASCMECPLSSIRQPRFEIGYEAARLLHDRLGGRSSRPISKVLPVELIERESSSLSTQ